MRRLRLIWSGVLVALLLAACGTPPPPSEAAARLNDADLDAATEMQGRETALPPGLSAALSGSGASSAAARAGDTLFSSGTLESASNGQARGQLDLGGWVAYVEQKGSTYSIRLVDLDGNNQVERRGDYVVYSGNRAIQSVAVSRDGQTVAFVAESKDGDNDVYLLDAQRGKVTSTRTPDADERDVSISLDGQALAWQGGTADEPSLVWYHADIGGYVEIDPGLWSALFGLELASAQPSISGDGLNVAFIERSGNLASSFGYPPYQGLVSMQFSVQDGVPSIEAVTLLYLGTQLDFPSLSYAGNRVLFYEIYSGVPYLSLLDLDTDDQMDLYGGLTLDHPFLTADGSHVTFSAFGDAYLLDLGTGQASAFSPNDKTVATATYWARGNFTAYSGRNTQGPFVKPDDGQTDAAGRTVPYHVYEFRPITTDFYAIESVQEHDGYLNLYVDNFNPKQPEKGLIASNDDWLHAWSEDTGGSSRIIAELQRNNTYFIVTSACGAPGTPCGPDSGYFRNVISDGAIPPPPPAPPTQLPEPDNSRFNITLRFWNDSLTDSEKAIFDVAAGRWEEVITGDLENIPNFSLSETQVTTGAPGIVGELDDVIIDAAKVTIDGAGGVLARAGAYYVRNGGASDFMPIYGIMEFDEAEFAPGGFFENLDGFAETIMHEMGHVLGISRSFWGPKGLMTGNPSTGCSDVANGDDPRYLGTAGNNAWVNDYGASTATVPLANTGGCGTADSHWREIYLQDELMTGYAQGGGEPLSLVTIGALQDLGYVVDFSAADYWFIPALPTLRQISPNAKDYAIEYDFTSAFTLSKLGSAQAAITPVDLALGAAAGGSTSGCEAADFAGFPAGNIALIQRGTCPFGDKAANALAAGASAILVGNQGSAADRMAPTTGTFGDAVDIIGVPISYDVMVELADLAATGEVVVQVNTDTSGLGGQSVFGPQALPKIEWHLVEELLPIKGSIDVDGNFTHFDD